MLPPGVLEQGEQAFLRVLRRRHPDAAFLPRARLPSVQKIRTFPRCSLLVAAGDFEAVEEAGENLPAFAHVEALPLHSERPADRQTRQAGI